MGGEIRVRRRGLQYSVLGSCSGSSKAIPITGVHQAIHRDTRSSGFSERPRPACRSNTSAGHTGSRRRATTCGGASSAAWASRTRVEPENGCNSIGRSVW